MILVAWNPTWWLFTGDSFILNPNDPKKRIKAQKKLPGFLEPAKNSIHKYSDHQVPDLSVQLHML